MSKLMRYIGLGFLVLTIAMAVGGQHAAAQGVPQYGSVKLTWKVLPLITLTVTPNYQTGFGPQGGTGSGSTPAPGAGATLNGGIVDFGTQVVQGYSYIYKYALQANVLTNDTSGFTLYAEGTNITDNTAGGTIPINQVLYWLVSNSSNGPFSSATAFNATSSATSAGCGGQCINYAGNPPATALIWNYPSSTYGQPSNTVSQGYDYQLRLASVNSTDNFSVYITYTAVGN